jgi:hypothetical protein
MKNMFNIDFEKNYEIKRIVDKRFRIYDKIIVIQYLIRWFEYEFEYDEWKFLFVLIDCIDFIEKYELTHFSKKNDKKKY